MKFVHILSHSQGDSHANHRDANSPEPTHITIPSITTNDRSTATLPDQAREYMAVDYCTYHRLSDVLSWNKADQDYWSIHSSHHADFGQVPVQYIGCSKSGRPNTPSHHTPLTTTGQPYGRKYSHLVSSIKWMHLWHIYIPFDWARNTGFGIHKSCLCPFFDLNTHARRHIAANNFPTLIDDLIGAGSATEHLVDGPDDDQIHYRDRIHEQL